MPLAVWLTLINDLRTDTENEAPALLGRKRNPEEYAKKCTSCQRKNSLCDYGHPCTCGKLWRPVSIRLAQIQLTQLKLRAEMDDRHKLRARRYFFLIDLC
jgi:hypothetical protein